MWAKRGDGLFDNFFVYLQVFCKHLFYEWHDFFKFQLYGNNMGLVIGKLAYDLPAMTEWHTSICAEIM